MSFSPGERLGPYEIVAFLGAGGMGEVWKARDTRLGRAVAIKGLKGRNTSRFEQEARALAALNHPSICQIYDVGPDYLVMEFIEGTPLLSPERPGPLAPPRPCGLRFRLLGTRARHPPPGSETRQHPLDGQQRQAAGLRLGKTCARRGRYSDFRGDRGRHARLHGAEQIEGRLGDARSDVFSFGSVLYEMLAGKRPLTG
jgi:hypothetical protein